MFQETIRLAEQDHGSLARELLEAQIDSSPEKAGKALRALSLLDTSQSTFGVMQKFIAYKDPALALQAIQKLPELGLTQAQSLKLIDDALKRTDIDKAEVETIKAAIENTKPVGEDVTAS